MMASHHQNHAVMLENQAKSCQKKSGTEGASTPTAPEPKPTVTWSRSLPDNITPPRAVEQGHVQDASRPEREHSFRSIGELAKEFLPVEKSLIDYSDDCEVLE